MNRTLLACIAAALLAAPAAFAYPQKETDVLSTISFAAATAGQKNRQGAEAYCRQAKKTLTKAADEAYLYAHIERCFAIVADVLGDKLGACKHFKNALDIWKKSPPPEDHPQSVASRTQLRDGMIRYRRDNCEG